MQGDFIKKRSLLNDAEKKWRNLDVFYTCMFTR